MSNKAENRNGVDQAGDYLLYGGGLGMIGFSLLGLPGLFVLSTGAAAGGLGIKGARAYQRSRQS